MLPLFRFSIYNIRHLHLSSRRWGVADGGMDIPLLYQLDSDTYIQRLLSAVTRAVDSLDSISVCAEHNPTAATLFVLLRAVAYCVPFCFFPPSFLQYPALICILLIRVPTPHGRRGDLVSPSISSTKAGWAGRTFFFPLALFFQHF